MNQIEGSSMVSQASNLEIHEVPDGYKAMNDREAIKVMVNPS